MRNPNVSILACLMLDKKKGNFNVGYFNRLAEVLKLNDKQINSVYKRLAKWLPKAEHLIDVSFLDKERKEDYKKLISERVKVFSK